MRTHATSTIVADRAALDAAFVASHERPVLLFLYDPYCPINHEAARQLAVVAHAIAIIDVAEEHALGMEVQARTGVRHESPQALVLRNGRAVWSASHGRIRARAVTTALHDAQLTPAHE